MNKFHEKKKSIETMSAKEVFSVGMDAVASPWILKCYLFFLFYSFGMEEVSE